MTDFRTAITDALEAQGVEPGQYEGYISAVVRNLEREESHRLARLRSVASEYTDGSTIDEILAGLASTTGLSPRSCPSARSCAHLPGSARPATRGTRT